MTDEMEKLLGKNGIRPRYKIVDANEPWEIREKLLVLGWEQKPLASADYFFMTNDFAKVGIERKTIGDAVNSIGDRLSKQLEHMNEFYQYKIILLEGSLRYIGDTGMSSDGGTIRMMRNAFWNFFRTWQDRGFTIEFTPNIEHTIIRLNELFAYYQKPGHTGGFQVGNYSDDRILAMPSGCRGEMGQQLIANYSLLEIANMSEQKLAELKCKGLGEKRIKLIYQHFHRKGIEDDSQIKLEEGLV